jgi:hypothetical protein
MSGERDPDIKQPPGTPAKEPNAPVEEPEDAPGPKAPVQEPEPPGPRRLANTNNGGEYREELSAS